MTQLAANRRIDVVHALIAGAALLAFIFTLCWAGDATGFAPPARRFVAFFADPNVGDRPLHFWPGAAWAAAVGASLGGVLALIWNGLNRLRGG
jgi:hypothetical protein